MNPTRLNGKRTGKNKADNGSKWITHERRLAIYIRDEFRCIYCDCETEDGLRTLDHFRPTELGGTNDSKNLGLACKSCNSSKGAKSTKNFILWLEENKGVNPEDVKNRIKRNTRRKVDISGAKLILKK